MPPTPTPNPSPQGGGEGALANRFILVANLEARDGGAAIVAGNERVVRARLSDAKFFWETDQKIRLEDRLEKLKSHRLPREARHAIRARRAHRGAGRELAPIVGADPDMAARAARLAKADLVTEMVGEFPELQGLMGRYYATAAGRGPVASPRAIEEHYKPLGPSDRVPTDPVVGRGGARRQDRHAGRLLGDRREADGEQGPVRAAAGGAGGDPVRAWRIGVRLAAAHEPG